MPQRQKPLKTLLAVLHITDRCNLKCRYCYASKSGKDMPLPVALQAIDFVAGIGHHYDSITIAFSGGEPTMVFGRVQKLVKQAQGKGINNFIICTNGVNLTREQVNFLAANNMAPTISLDGVFQAQNLNRPFASQRGTWEKISENLKLFKGFEQSFDKQLPDYLRLRCTLTLETIKFLNKSIHYLANSPVSQIAMITLMPAMPSRKKWEKLFKSTKLLKILNDQIQQIVNFYFRQQKNGKSFRFCLNECLTIKFSDFFNFYKKNSYPFCGAGVNKLGISLTGKIYPCYLFAAQEQGNEKFCLGDVFDGFRPQKEINKICAAFKENRFFSCLYWNYQENKNPNLAALAYQILFRSFLRAIINSNLRNFYPSMTGEW